MGVRQIFGVLSNKIAKHQAGDSVISKFILPVFGYSMK